VTETVTYSTLLLTLLMVVGLVFFIRASTKDRTETTVLERSTEPLALLQTLTAHFEGRAYRVSHTDPSAQRIVLRGQVRPSLFLAIFLTLLAAVGALCFGLVLTNLWPSLGWGVLGLLLLAPGAGWFYWRGAARAEEVSLQIRPSDGANPGSALAAVAVTAHRDELIALDQALKASGD
jgi:hypothetical protein